MSTSQINQSRKKDIWNQIVELDFYSLFELPLWKPSSPSPIMNILRKIVKARVPCTVAKFGEFFSFTNGKTFKYRGKA